MSTNNDFRFTTVAKNALLAYIDRNRFPSEFKKTINLIPCRDGDKAKRIGGILRSYLSMEIPDDYINAVGNSGKCFYSDEEILLTEGIFSEEYRLCLIRYATDSGKLTEGQLRVLADIPYTSHEQKAYQARKLNLRIKSKGKAKEELTNALNAKNVSDIGKKGQNLSI